MFIRLMLAYAITVLASVSARASLHCGTQLIDEGDLMVEVLRKYGEPAQREVIPAATTSGTDKRFNAVNVENWVYGPGNGMYQYLRFIDGKLVQIRSDRK